MKNLLLLLVLPLILISCSSDDDKDENNNDILTLTRWEQKIDNTTYAFQFTTDNYCNYVRQKESLTPFSAKYRYKIEGNKLSIHYLSPNGYGELITTGTFNNDEIRITFDEKDLTLKQVPYVKY